MKCFVCKKDIPAGRGKMFVMNDGRIFYFCSSKCKKNWGFGRTEKRIKWAKGKKKKQTLP